MSDNTPAIIRIGSFDSLNDAKAVAMKEIDGVAEEARLRYITPGAGQALEYNEVMLEIQALSEDDTAATPFLDATVAAGLASSRAQAIDQVNTQHNVWATVGAGVRELRLMGKRLISEAASQEEVHNIKKSYIQWLNEV